MEWREMWRLGQRGWPAEFPIAQFPNAPLLVAFAAMVVRATTSGDVSAAADATARVGLSVWAYEELRNGTNWFRRTLGAAGLIYVVATLAADL